MECLKVLQCSHNRSEILGYFFGNPKWMETAKLMTILQQLLIADREEGSAQGRKDRQLIFRPFDGGEGGAQGFDLGTIMKGATADKQMRNAARLEVWAGHIFLVADETAKQQANMPGLNGHEVLRFTGPKT